MTNTGIHVADTIVLADGLFPTRPELLQLFAQCRHIVCCDRAYLKYREYARQDNILCGDGMCSVSTETAVSAADLFSTIGMEHASFPTKHDVYVVGDGDSLPQDCLPELGDHFIHIQEQENNDLTKAVHFCFLQGWEHIIILGATGLREDHTLGNISLLAEYLHEKPEANIHILSDFGTFSAVFSSATFSSFKGQQVSIFSLVPDKRVWCAGLAYPIQGRPLTNWWQGTLNEALTTSFTVRVEDGGTLIIFQTLQNKDTELLHKQ